MKELAVLLFNYRQKFTFRLWCYGIMGLEAGESSCIDEWTSANWILHQRWRLANCCWKPSLEIP